MPRLIPTLLAALALGVAATAPAADTHPAAQAVLDFNHAINAEDMDAALALVAAGGVQFQLHPAHPGMADDPPLTADLAVMWKTVSAILFPTTENYARQIEIIDVFADGELAVVWTRTKTATKMKEQAEPMALSFTEMYLLVNKNGSGWRIAGTASNRPVDDILVGWNRSMRSNASLIASSSTQ